MSGHKKFLFLTIIAGIVCFSDTFCSTRRKGESEKAFRARSKRELMFKKQQEATERGKKRQEEVARKKREQEQTLLKKQQEQAREYEKQKSVQPTQQLPVTQKSTVQTQETKTLSVEEKRRLQIEQVESEKKRQEEVKALQKQKEKQKRKESQPQIPPTTTRKVIQQELTKKAQLVRCLKQGVMGCFAFFRELKGTGKVVTHMMLPMVVSSLLSRAIKRGDIATAASIFLLFGAKGGLRHIMKLPVQFGGRKLLSLGSFLGGWGLKVTRTGALAKKIGSLMPSVPVPGVVKKVGTGAQLLTGQLMNTLLKWSSESIVSSAYYSVLEKIPGYTRFSRAIAPEPGEEVSSKEYRAAFEDILGSDIVEQFFPPQQEQIPEKIMLPEGGQQLVP